MKAEIVYASEYEEFFYKDSDIPVSEGNIVGVEVDIGDSIDLILLEDIYFQSCHE